MNHRENFVKAIFAVSDMDELLARMDTIFVKFQKLVIARAKKQISDDEFKDELQRISKEKKLIFQKYETIKAKIQAIKDQYGGEVRA